MRTSRLLASLAAGAVALPAALSAQRVDPSRIINMHINAEAQNVSLSGSIPEGGRFRLTLPDRRVYALSPVLVQGQTFSVTLLRGDGKPEDGDKQNWRVVETVQAIVGRPVPFRTLHQVTVVIEGVDAAAQATAAAAPVRFEPASYRLLVRSMFFLYDGECCVTCNGVGGCGCKVDAPCGSCCVAPCRCDTQPAPPPGGLVLGRGRDILTAASRRRCPPVPDDERIFTARAGHPAAMVLSSR